MTRASTPAQKKSLKKKTVNHSAADNNNTLDYEIFKTCSQEK